MRTSKHKATYALLIEILLRDCARFNTHLMPTEEEKPHTVLKILAQLYGFLRV